MIIPYAIIVMIKYLYSFTFVKFSIEYRATASTTIKILKRKQYNNILVSLFFKYNKIFKKDLENLVHRVITHTFFKWILRSSRPTSSTSLILS
jgi:hypothetical protein